ncbi:hypothetical protein ACA910_014964 [Epithemia clementina (nom. ined.)]
MNEKSQEEDTPSTAVLRLDSDVMVGSGRLCTAGNERFQNVVKWNAQRYNQARQRTEKSRIVVEIIGTIKAWGGRFLYQSKATSSTSTRKETWAFATNAMIRKKVGQAIRYQLEYLKYEVSLFSPSEDPNFPFYYSRKRKSRDSVCEGSSSKCTTSTCDGTGSLLSQQSHCGQFSDNCSYVTCPLPSDCTTRSISASTNSLVLKVEEDFQQQDGMDSHSSDDDGDSDNSWDVFSVAARMAIEMDNEGYDHDIKVGITAPKESPLLSDYEILSSLGYDPVDAFLHVEPLIDEKRMALEQQGAIHWNCSELYCEQHGVQRSDELVSNGAQLIRAEANASTAASSSNHESAVVSRSYIAAQGGNFYWADHTSSGETDAFYPAVPKVGNEIPDRASNKAETDMLCFTTDVDKFDPLGCCGQPGDRNVRAERCDDEADGLHTGLSSSQF